MARRSTRKKPQGLRGRLAALRAVPLRSIRPYARVAVWVLGLAGLVAGWIVGVPRLEARVATRAGPHEIRIQFTNLPRWVESDLLAMLELTAVHQLGADPLHQEDLAGTRRALLNTGWFESIDQVRRVRNDLLRIDASFARPMAVIRDRNGDHLVDVYGRLLPRSYPHGTASSLMVIDGVRFERPQRPGMQWDGADVTAALRLLRLIETEPWQKQVATIDVTDYLTQETLILITDRGSRIIWGSPPGAEAVGEATSERKLAYLDYAYEEYRHIDAGHRGKLDYTRPSGVFAD